MGTYRRVDPRQWTDGRLDGLTPAARLLLVALATSHDITAAGVVPIVPGRWSIMTGLEAEQADAALDELVAAGHVVADRATAEVLIVAHIDTDDAVRSPNGAKSVARAVDKVISRLLADTARALALEATPAQLKRLLEAPSEAPSEAPGRGAGGPPAALHEPRTMNQEPPTTSQAPAAADRAHDPAAIARMAGRLHVEQSTGAKNPDGLRRWTADKLTREHPDLLEELSHRDDLPLRTAAEYLLTGQRPGARADDPRGVFIDGAGWCPRR